MGPSNDGLVLPCLYRHSYQIEPEDSRQRQDKEPQPVAQLQPQCILEVHRVMRERAISVRLLPDLEQDCISELGSFCSEKVQPGEEIMCLQVRIISAVPATSRTAASKKYNAAFEM